MISEQVLFFGLDIPNGGITSIEFTMAAKEKKSSPNTRND